MKLKLYGAAWCGFCRTLQQLLEKENVEYQYMDVEQKTNEDKMLQLTDGRYLIPTVSLGQKFLQNPTIQEVKELINV